MGGQAKSPDIRQFLQIQLPAEILKALKIDETDNIQKPRNSFEIEANQNESKVVETHVDLLPAKVDTLPHETKDVIKRLLNVDPKQRLRSVLAMQKIAMYKNFTINAKNLLSIRPLDIIQRDNITLRTVQEYNESSSILATKAFQDF